MGMMIDASEEGGIKLTLRDIALRCDSILPEHMRFSVDSHFQKRGPKKPPSEHRIHFFM